MNNKLSKLFLFVVVAFAAAVFFALDFHDYLTLESLKTRQEELRALFESSPLKFALLFALTYIVVTTLSIPGAAVMTLAAGFIFDFFWALTIVSVSSTIGATLAFFGARFLFRDVVANSFGTRLKAIDQGLKHEGSYYILTLRLLPIVPFFLVNLALGVTGVRTITYIVFSFIGMIPGTAVYVNAGTQLSQVGSLSDILSPSLIASFAILAFFPMITKYGVAMFKNHQMYKRFKKPKTFDYNLIVIGAGSAGLVSAYIASVTKAKVALIEKNKMGGDCLNTGCVPSKALIRSAKIASEISQSKAYGIDSKNVEVSFSRVMDRVNEVIRKIEPHDSIERFEKLGVHCLSGEARLTSPFEVEIGNQKLTTQNIILATGAGPLVPPIPGLRDIDFLTSDNIWKLRVLPKRLLVLGGGPIGCELAQAFQRLGSQVILVEMSDRILSREDEDASQLLTKVFEQEGIQILTSHEAVRFEVDQSKTFLVCKYQDKEVRIEFDQVLLALGRQANVKGFGLEELGVRTTARGTIEVNERLQTNYPNIYACGDVAGPFQFTHTASHQAWYASLNSLLRPLKAFQADYRVIPWCTFVDPEVARVGLSEAEAKEQNVDFEVTKYELSDLDRAITESEELGFIKVITKKGKDKILGVTIVGSHAGDIISEFVLAMKHGIGLKKILSTIHIYPTFAEANRYAASVWQQNHMPEWALRLFSRYLAWRRS